jgi:NAD(P)-dependent dehydrogenase (short-subunit alcohol dehydrogenase family)
MSSDTFRADLFAGKVALVTGAGRGIGAGIARAFASLGATVLVHDRDSTGAGTVAKELPRDARAIAGDLAIPGEADRVFGEALGHRGRIDFLINNAGMSWAAETEEIGEEKVQQLIELNLKSVLYLSKQFIAHARQREGGGAIVQISSTAGITGFERRAVYVATKFAVIGLTKVLALDHARDGIRVNAVLPHVVETEMFRTVAKPAEADLWRKGIPIGRFATVEDVASLVMFLCSPASSYLTGGAYPVDGGAMAGPYGGEA